jgi:hypothetical protein
VAAGGTSGEDDRAAALRAELDADAALLVEIVLERWIPAPDPLGDPILLPRHEDEDPVRLDDLDWAAARAAFRARHGRSPAPGARALARRALAARSGRGGH